MILIVRCFLAQQLKEQFEAGVDSSQVALQRGRPLQRIVMFFRDASRVEEPIG